MCVAPFLSKSNLLLHLRNHHSIIDYKNGLIRQQLDCKKIFKTYESFRVHISTYHDVAKEQLLKSTIKSEAVSNAFSSGASFEAPDASTQCDIKDEEMLFDSPANFAQEFSSLCLKAQDYHVLPVQTVKNIMDVFVKICTILVLECEKAANRKFLKDEISDVKAIWHHFKKKKHYDQFCKSLSLVEPIPVPVDVEAIAMSTGEQRWSRGHKFEAKTKDTKKSKAKAKDSPSEDRPSRGQG